MSTAAPLRRCRLIRIQRIVWRTAGQSVIHFILSGRPLTVPFFSFIRDDRLIQDFLRATRTLREKLQHADAVARNRQSLHDIVEALRHSISPSPTSVPAEATPPLTPMLSEWDFDCDDDTEESELSGDCTAGDNSLQLSGLSTSSSHSAVDPRGRLTFVLQHGQVPQETSLPSALDTSHAPHGRSPAVTPSQDVDNVLEGDLLDLQVQDDLLFRHHETPRHARETSVSSSPSHHSRSSLGPRDSLTRPAVAEPSRAARQGTIRPASCPPNSPLVPLPPFDTFFTQVARPPRQLVDAQIQTDTRDDLISLRSEQPSSGSNLLDFISGAEASSSFVGLRNENKDSNQRQYTSLAGLDSSIASNAPKGTGSDPTERAVETSVPSSTVPPNATSPTTSRIRLPSSLPSFVTLADTSVDSEARRTKGSVQHPAVKITALTSKAGEFKIPTENIPPPLPLPPPSFSQPKPSSLQSTVGRSGIRTELSQTGSPDSVVDDSGNPPGAKAEAKRHVSDNESKSRRDGSKLCISSLVISYSHYTLTQILTRKVPGLRPLPSPHRFLFYRQPMAALRRRSSPPCPSPQQDSELWLSVTLLRTRLKLRRRKAKTYLLLALEVRRLGLVEPWYHHRRRTTCNRRSHHALSNNHAPTTRRHHRKARNWILL